jgi:acetyl-CoA carboxylase carboxyl transferase subunit beta
MTADVKADWRTALLDAVPLPGRTAGGRNPIRWPGYDGYDAVRWAAGPVAGHDVVACVWDFGTYGGSFGEREADALVAACAKAAAARFPLVTFVRTGGTRLQEGMAALVGIPRAALALERLADAGVPHLSVADQPTTGGVWVAVTSGADLRVGVAGATVGFSGPRVVEAMTGQPLPEGSHTAEGAFGAGLLDAVGPGEQVGAWLDRALGALGYAGGETSRADTAGEIGDVAPPETSGIGQVQRARTADRPDGAVLLDRLLDGAVDLRGADQTVRAVAGRAAGGRPVVAVALAACRGGRPTPAGYALLERAASLADRLRLPLLLLVDTPGADPGADSEAGGIASAIAGGMRAVLRCRSATLAVVHGEGGSGGALAAATADLVLVTENGYFTALGPEGAAAALRCSAEEAADLMALRPADLRQLGFADRVVSSAGLRATVAAGLHELAEADAETRRTGRIARWSAPLSTR